MAEPDPQPAPYPQNAFLIVNGSYVFPLEKELVTIGRKTDNDLVIDILHISRYHAEIRAQEGQFHLLDLKSTGGTSINGKPIEQEKLRSGDVISLAGVPLIYGESPMAKKLQDDSELPRSRLKQSSHPTRASTDSIEAASIDQFLDMFDSED